MTATPQILSMSPTQIEEKNKEEAVNQLLLLDSGVSQHVHIKRGDPSENRIHGDRITFAYGGEIVILEFKNKFNRLVLVGAFQQ